MIILQVSRADERSDSGSASIRKWRALAAPSPLRPFLSPSAAFASVMAQFGLRCRTRPGAVFCTPWRQLALACTAPPAPLSRTRRSDRARRPVRRHAVRPPRSRRGKGRSRHPSRARPARPPRPFPAPEQDARPPAPLPPACAAGPPPSCSKQRHRARHPGLPPACAAGPLQSCAPRHGPRVTHVLKFLTLRPCAPGVHIQAFMLHARVRQCRHGRADAASGRRRGHHPRRNGLRQRRQAWDPGPGRGGFATAVRPSSNAMAATRRSPHQANQGWPKARILGRASPGAGQSSGRIRAPPRPPKHLKSIARRRAI